MLKIAMLSKLGESKWRLVQEARRIDHSQVVGLYGAGMKVRERNDVAELLLGRMAVMSRLFEEERLVPVEYLYLKLREVG
jgi:hypothetical protein